MYQEERNFNKLNKHDWQAMKTNENLMDIIVIISLLINVPS